MTLKQQLEAVVADSGALMTYHEDYRTNAYQLKQYYTELLKIIPSSDAYDRRAIARYYIAEYADAIEDWSKAIQLDEQNPQLYVCRGEAWARLGQYKQAVADYERAEQLLQEPIDVNYDLSKRSKANCYFVLYD